MFQRVFSILSRGIKPLQLIRRYGTSPNNPKNWRDRLRASRSKYIIIPVGLSLPIIYYMGFQPDDSELENCYEYSLDSRWQVKFVRLLPRRITSRIFGWFCTLDLPTWGQNLFLSWFIKTYNVNLSEAEREDVHDYKNLADLFSRKLKSSLRPLDEKSLIVCPCDGTIQHFGKVDLESGRLEQVKGISYSLVKFLGTKPRNLEENPYQGKSLFFCTFYLSPGDYHRFHSPADWAVCLRRHFRGQLLSVRPSYANWIPGLLTINERAVYIGEWKYGYFSMTPVGAKNVGSIKMYSDPDLNTNSARTWNTSSVNEKLFSTQIKFSKGSPFGEFNLGSSIVLIFEAPDEFQFKVKPGQKVQWGQALFN